MRLVPNQDPDDIRSAIRLREETHPKGFRPPLKFGAKAQPAWSAPDNKYIKAATEALHDVFKNRRSLSALWFYSHRDRFQDVLKVPSVMMGFGCPMTICTLPMRSSYPNFYRGLNRSVCFLKAGGK